MNTLILKVIIVKRSDSMKKRFSLFQKLSERHGVDIDQVILDKNQEELKKLDKSLRKETMKVRTKIIEEENKRL